jgi:hypothetical protein
MGRRPAGGIETEQEVFLSLELFKTASSLIGRNFSAIAQTGCDFMLRVPLNSPRPFQALAIAAMILAIAPTAQAAPKTAQRLAMKDRSMPRSRVVKPLNNGRAGFPSW